MTDYKKYINALRKCAKEHENDRTSMGHIIVSDLCRDTANLLETIEQEPCSVQPNKWIPFKTRPMTEEETEHYFEYTDMRIDDTYTILDCPLPDDGQEVLISWGGNVCIDIFIKDYDGCYFEGVDIDEVDAWQPLPEPYKPTDSEKE